MKILLALFTTFLLVNTSIGQIMLNAPSPFKKERFRTYQMPDGAILKGRIIGRLQQDSVVIETRDGLVYHVSNEEAKKTGKLFSPPESAPRQRADVAVVKEEEMHMIPLAQQPLFQKGASQIGVDLMTHFSSGGTSENVDPESGIIFSASYLYGLSRKLKVGGGVGLMTVKSGSKERIYPLFLRGEYQVLPKVSASLSGGYSIIPTNEFVLQARNGIFGSANVAFDLVGPESPYTSRIGIGLVLQEIDLGRTEIIREGGFGTQRTYTQYVERSGLMRRIQITFTHAWRMPQAMGGNSKKKAAAKRRKKRG